MQASAMLIWAKNRLVDPTGGSKLDLQPKHRLLVFSMCGLILDPEGSRIRLIAGDR